MGATHTPYCPVDLDDVDPEELRKAEEQHKKQEDDRNT